MGPLTRIGDNRTCTKVKTTQAHLRMNPKTRKKTRMLGFIWTDVWTKRHMNTRCRRMLLTRSAIFQAEEWVTGLNSNQEQWRETSAGRGAKLSPLIRSRSEEYKSNAIPRLRREAPSVPASPTPKRRNRRNEIKLLFIALLRAAVLRKNTVWAFERCQISTDGMSEPASFSKLRRHLGQRDPLFCHDSERSCNSQIF